MTDQVECRRCGAIFEQTKTGPAGRPRLYCSPRCGELWRAEHRPRKAPPLAECGYCGKAIVSRRAAGRNRKFCDSTCWSRARAGLPLVRPCEFCSVAIPSSRPHDRYCSEECQRLLAQLRRRGPVLPRRCAECSGRFTPKAKSSRYCSRRCGRKAQRRHRRAGGGDAPAVGLAELVDRDGWWCGICFDPIDPARRWPDPLSVSIDHVVALVFGGSNDEANLQLAHLGCNCRKGARDREKARAIA